MTLEEIYEQLCDALDNTTRGLDDLGRPKNRLTAAKLVKEWLDEQRATLSSPRELRMVPGPPPADAVGDYLIRSDNYGFVLVENWTARGRKWGNIASHAGPVLPYEPPKPLTCEQQCALIDEWLAAHPNNEIRMYRGCVTLDAAHLTQPKQFKNATEAAEWIRAQGGV
jgi:hypothetical protein